MRIQNIKATMKVAVRVASLVLLVATAAFGQTMVSLTAGPATATQPDGTAIPMWGYSCGTIGAACRPLNPAATSSTIWSPVVITVPTGQTLTISLTNNLSFMPTGSTAANTVPTSITIVGQVGGGLGVLSQRTTTVSPDHSDANLTNNGVTWPTVGTGPTFTPPAQGPRVQSFATEVPAGATSGVTSGVPALTWNNLKPGTYLLESGTHPSIQGPMGLYGILVVTGTPGTATGTAYPGVTYGADVPLLFSEIDPIQNKSVQTAVSTAGFLETTVWSGQTGACGNPSSPVGVANTCYPPAVNYTPLYYMINGVAFNKTSATASLFPATLDGAAASATITGNVLVRMVNAGLRMHVPSIVGSLTTQAQPTTGGVSPAPAVNGFSIVAEDGNPLPGLPRVQNEVFMAAGKTYDVLINAPAAGTTAIPVYDRELSLSGNAIDRDAGMLAYISVNSAALPASAALAPATVQNISYSSLVPCTVAPCTQLNVTDPSKGVISVDTNVYGAQFVSGGTNGVLTLNANGTFTYLPNVGTSSDSFIYCANGTVTVGVCSSGLQATVSLKSTTVEASSGIICTIPNPTFTSTMATYLAIKTPGVLQYCQDAAKLPLKVATSTVTPSGGMGITPDSEGGFTATTPAAGTYSFTFQAQNSQGVLSAAATVTVVFPAGSGLKVAVVDGNDKTTPITDYRWIIEEDRTFYVDPNCTTDPVPAGCPTATIGGTGIVPTFGTNFHTSYMPYVAQGCTGTLSCEGGQYVYDPLSGNHLPAVCDVGDGACRTTGTQLTAVDPSQVVLDPTKRYYISVLPGDAANPFGAGYGGTPDCSTAGHCGHGMGGAPIAAPCAVGATCSISFAAVTILTQPSPYPPGRLSVSVFEDDFPLNGEQDAGGGIDVLATQEPGLGGFQIHLWDAMGGNGDFTGQMSYDMFNQPLTNSLAGAIDPATRNDACPISTIPRPPSDPTAGGITGMIVTCPKFESDRVTLSPLAGQAVVNNLMPGRWGVIATPGADRIARGEEWLQTNTLDGQKAHDVFTRIGEPIYFQEYGPAGYHVSIGFANPKIINSRLAKVCAPGGDGFVVGTNCKNTITGTITGQRLSRSPDERLYESGSRDTYYWTQCYVSVGDPDGEDFAFTKCDAKGNFTISGLPDGVWRVTTFDQWNDQLVDGLSTPVSLSGGTTVPMGDIAATQWQTNLYTKTFIDDKKSGVSDDPSAPGIPFANVAVRLRDGSLANLLVTDFTGTANFNETFPLFSWYTVETDVTRYKNTGTHVVYDAGGPADGSSACGKTGFPPCGTSTIGKFLANTAEQISVPSNLRVPGSVYCDLTRGGADCTGYSIQNGPSSSASSNCTAGTTGVTCGAATLSTGRIDNPWLGAVEGWQGFPGQNNFIEFGKEPYVPGENGGIKGHVIYASTRPFDDPQMLVQTQWEPLVPHVVINLYQEAFAADGVTPTLTLVDYTQTSSWDDYAQGFHTAPDGTTVPNMNCPGQGTGSGVDADLFFFTLFNQPDYLNFYSSQHGGALTSLPYNSQFKCYDGMHNWNQIQPAPYDGAYQFPSVIAMDPTTGRPTGTHCTICITDGAPNNLLPANDLYYGLPMLPTGKYVVEIVMPPGYELVKEEDKNILIGDDFIAPVTQEFGGLGNIFIIPDQATVASTYQDTTGQGNAYNANSSQNPTQSFGASPNNGIVPGFVPEPTWPCVGESRIVPDYISLYPWTKQVAPFAGATRNLCDRKEVTLGDQMGAIAKFYIYTSTHIASKFTGGITDDFTSEFDPFSPQFGEKFAPPNMPISIKDWTGSEISRVYSDQWGAYDGMTYSTWEVNPPNPTGYSPTMMVVCMNDPGNGPTPDPLFNPAYSQFCYELPFMPGTTQYLDTPVVPTSAFSEGYNHPDCNYPALTPAIKEVDGDGIGPWVSAAGHPITITALGDQTVTNYGYSGPSATTAPFNQKTLTRHYGFGGTQGSVTIGGVQVPSASITGWGDLSITLNVPIGVPNCAVQQQAQYSGSTAQCGELVVTTAAGQQSVDTVTVTIGGKAPIYVVPTPKATTNSPFGAIQSAINAAAPGDLIIVPPGVYPEILLMWKPVRLQGVGAASTVINANSQPAGRMDIWRAAVNCLFGLALNGQPYSTPGNLVPLPGSGVTGSGVPAGKFEPLNPYDSTGAQSCPATGWKYFYGGPNNPQVDRIPLEGILEWDTTLNGNLAELLQEPSLMGAYEGAGITVLGKGVRYPAGLEVFGAFTDIAAGSFVAHEGQMPALVDSTGLLVTGTTVLTNSPADCDTMGTPPTGYSSNFQCNPSSIDGLSVTDSSQGGGGIYAHGWAHNLQIANDRVYNNTGTLTGGITVGQGESPDALLIGNNGDPVGFDQQPWTCLPGAVTPGAKPNQNPTFGGLLNDTQLPYCYNVNVNVHNNYVTQNSSIGDELFSGTPAGAGGVSFCTGSDYYKFNYNWVCGNLSTGDGGGLAHMGFSYDGDIEHNTFIFNQSLNPTIATHGGGAIIMGAAPDGTPIGAAAGTECGSVTDVDCAPGLPDGTGPGLIINANLFQGNSAESGSGGGLRLQSVSGTEVGFFPNGDQTNPNPNFEICPAPATTCPVWNTVTVTNNIFANNVAGWDGAGVSLQDALAVNFINNTVSSNDTTASAGVLFNTLGAPNSSAPGPCPGNTNPSSATPCVVTSTPQPAGLVTMQNTSLLAATLPILTVCPPGHFTASLLLGIDGNCRAYSVPLLANNVFWQNRSFNIAVGALGPGTQNQQNVVTLRTGFTGTTAASQPTADATIANGTGKIITGGTGACVTPNAAPNYWDIGVRGDTGPANHGSGLTLAPSYSILTSTTGYAASNTTGNPTVLSQYCNGSRTPPEFLSLGYQLPPGISDATVPNPIFSLTPSATVDEGNNWINMSWGPLAQTSPMTGSLLGNYGPASSSRVINYIPNSGAAAANFAVAPSTDFYGTLRKTDNAVDAGAVEFVAPANTALGSVTGGPLAFGSVMAGATSAAQSLTLHSTGTLGLSGITLTITGPFSRSGGTCGATAAAGTTCTINIVFTPTAVTSYAGTVSITSNVAIPGSPVSLSGTGAAATLTASVSPSPLAFGNWAIGTASNVLALEVTNTGNSPLAGGTFTLSGGTPQPFSRVTTGTFPAGVPNCVAALAVGASCSVKVQFAPTATGSLSRTLAVAYPGATVTTTPVSLTGTGVAARATVSITPNPLTITLPTGSITGTALVTLTNTAPSGTGASMTVSNVTASGGNFLTYIFNMGALAGPDGCTGTTLPAGASCAVTLRFTNVLSARGANRAGTISFTDNAAASPQTGSLIGHANP